MKTTPKISPTPSVRAEATTLRSYCRPKEDGSLETWDEVVDRVIGHQRWLWERAQGAPLNAEQVQELEEFGDTLMRPRKAVPAGRTQWLGGTEISRTRESCMFNCSFCRVVTHFDVVDCMWLLLQGCGVGFTPVTGTLHGYRYPLDEIQVIRSERTTKGGDEDNKETFDPDTATWTVRVGDSAEAWAKAVGKLLIGKFPARRLVIDLSQIRQAGERLKGYGWISSGDSQIAVAFPAIAKILSERAEQLLTKINILDVMNHLGTVLSSRRSAEICLIEYGSAEWEEFAVAKKNYWEKNKQRGQSNNSLVFFRKPARKEIEHVFALMTDAGGSEPGFVNGEAALKRAPWFVGGNPCFEILLCDKGFCNLAEVNLPAFKGDMPALQRAIYLTARANYRQTCVDLRDGILQEAWHSNNEFFRLCGVSATGVVGRPDLADYEFKMLKNIAVSSAHGMAAELKMPLPKNVTCCKPSGTISKIMGSDIWGEVSEGAHKPQGKYLFNEITFSKHDPMVERMREGGYHVQEKPFEPESVLVRFPVKYEGIPFTRKAVVRKDGTREMVDLNVESAVEQLNRYKMLMENWCEQNVSITIYYDVAEIPAIVRWILKNWDSYVGVSFIYRSDPSKNAQDLGYAYLPQTVVSEKTYLDYVKNLKPVDLRGVAHAEQEQEGCATGACPIR